MAKVWKKFFVLGNFMDKESFCNLEHHAQNVLEHTSNSDNVSYAYLTVHHLDI